MTSSMMDALRTDRENAAVVEINPAIHFNERISTRSNIINSCSHDRFPPLGSTSTTSNSSTSSTSFTSTTSIITSTSGNSKLMSRRVESGLKPGSREREASAKLPRLLIQKRRNAPQTMKPPRGAGAGGGGVAKERGISDRESGGKVERRRARQ